jgi:hypothetical protein
MDAIDRTQSWMSDTQAMGLYSTLLFSSSLCGCTFRLKLISKRLAGTKPGARVLARARYAIQNDQAHPKDLRALPGQPEAAVSWHSEFRGRSPYST